MTLLACRNVSKRFGGIQALDDLDLTVERGQITGLIGPNGAGKTTLFDVVTGVHPPTAGTVEFDGETLDGLAQHERTRRGVARAFQSPRVLGQLTVDENLDVARHFGSGEAGPDTPDIPKPDVLDLLDLTDQIDVEAETLQITEQRYLNFACALMTRPKLVLLDETMAGLNPTEKENVMGVVEDLHDGYAVDFLVIEHDLRVIRELSDRIVVINEGAHLADGSVEEVIQNEAVRRAYVGT